MRASPAPSWCDRSVPHLAPPWAAPRALWRRRLGAGRGLALSFLVACTAPSIVRAEAAEPVALENIQRGLRSESFKVRATAAVALGQLKDPRAIAPLEAALVSDSHFAVRAAAASALGRLGLAGVERPLLDALEDPDPLVRAEVRKALKRLSAPEHLPGLERSLDVGSPEQRRLAVATIGRIGATAPAAVPLLLTALDDEDPSVASAARTALETVPLAAARPALLGALREGAAGARVEAARLLSREPAEDSAAALSEAYGGFGETAEVRSALRAAIQSHRAFYAPSVLLEQAARPGEDPERRQAIAMLGALGDGASFNVMKRAIADPSPRVRTAAARAALEIDPDRGRDLVTRAVALERDERVRRQLSSLLKAAR